MVNGNPNGQMAGTAPLIGWFKYYPNGTSTVTSYDGPLARYISSITYAATGKQTIVFSSEFGFGGDLAFVPKASFDAVANAFSASQMGAYASNTLIIQQHQGTSGFAAAAHADNHVVVFVYGDQSSV